MTHVGDQAKKGSLGVAQTRLAIEKHLGWAFREQPLPDIGIDAQFEVLDGPMATGRLVALQIKSGPSYFRAPADTGGWWFSATVDHFRYWLNHTCPVLVVLCDLKTGTTYWQQVNEETVLRATGHRWKLLVPESQVLDGAARDTLQKIAQLPATPILSSTALGTRITEVDPRRLEVHSWPSLPGSGVDSPPFYISRPHDDELDALALTALREPPRSAIKILVGESKTGKTRALYEMLIREIAGTEQRSLANRGWRIWPSDPTSPQRFLEGIPRIGPRTVIWLNEAQRYLLEPSTELRNAIAEELHSLVTSPDRGPVLILGTLWPTYVESLIRHSPENQNKFARHLLDANYLRVPDSLTRAEQETARTSGDARLVEAASQAEDGEIIQFLAGGPTLRLRYETADSRQRAIIHAAMDARRLGHSEWLPPHLLPELARAYMTKSLIRVIDSDRSWFTTAIASLTELRDDVALFESAPSGYRMDDYLDQLGRERRRSDFPPQSFWETLIRATIDTEDKVALAESAAARLRFDIAVRMYQAAATRTAGMGLLRLAEYYERRRYESHADRLAWEASELGYPEALTRMARLHMHRDHKSDVEALLRGGVEGGDPDACILLASALERRGEHEEAEAVALAAMLRGLWEPIAEVAEWRYLDAPNEATEMILKLPIGLRSKAYASLILSLDDVGDHHEAESLAHQLAAEGAWELLLILADNRHSRGDEESSSGLYQAFADVTGDNPVPGSRHRSYAEHTRTSTTNHLVRSEDAEWLADDYERAETAASAAVWLIEHGQLALAEEAAHEAAANGVDSGLLRLTSELVQRGEPGRADELAMKAINMSDCRSIYVPTEQEPAALLADVRKDREILLTGLDAAGNKESFQP